MITKLATLKKILGALKIYLNHYRKLNSNLYEQNIYSNASKFDQSVDIAVILNNCLINHL